MKKIILSLLSAIGVVCGASAQSVNLPDGYYRVTNALSDRYIHVLDNKGSINVQTSSADMGAIILKKGIERSVSDPASVIYVENHGNNQFDFKAQGTGIHDIIGIYVNLLASHTVSGAYMCYASHSGVTMYLWDAKSNLDAAESYLETTGGCSRDWFVKPISNDTDNYFGVKPTHEAGGKYYTSFYAAFPFSFASAGMKAYYVTKVDESQGVAVYKEITGTVPAYTPVIIECSSDNYANNKLNIGGSASSVSGNIGTGVFFELHKNKHDNYVTYQPTMRTIGITSDGSIGMTKGSYQDVPKNTFYLSVSSNCPQELKLIPESEYHEGPIAATSVTLNQTSLSMQPGDSFTLTATVSPSNTTDPTVTWSSSNSQVATVNSSGVVTAIAPGTATITAKCGSVQATCTVTVNAVMATSITLNYTSLTLNVGQSQTLSATVSPSNTTDPTVTWTSSNTQVATVSSSGVVTAIAPGTATITAKCGSVQASCAVTVSQIEAQSITLNHTSLTLLLGESATLTASVSPADTTDPTVTWTSSNTQVATVSANGYVTAVGVGTATITAKCGSVQASCTVTVNPVEAQSISLNHTSLTLTLGATASLTATVSPANTTDPTVTWSSADTQVATVDANGTVTAVGLGSTTITAKCGSVQASCAVTVNPVEATGITLNYTSLTLYPGDTADLIATVTPANTTDPTVTWTSSRPSVATVDENGHVTAVSIGNANITAKCGTVETHCTVSVVPVEAQEVTLSQTSLTLNPGAKARLIATVSPANTTDPTVTWSSSNFMVATVTQQGVVTGAFQGTAIITAKCGSAEATCTVTVSPIEASSITLDFTELDLATGETIRLTPTVLPEEVADKAVEWSSSDASVASVNVAGEVTGVAPGEAVITAKVDNVTAQCIVRVSDVDCEYIELDVASLELREQDTYQLTATVHPANTSYPTVAWSSANPQIATVDDSGLVTAVKAGVTVISASCGDATTQCEVTVMELDSLESIIGDGASFDVYNLQGIKVRSGVVSLQGLPHGYYIVNGHTVLVK